MDGAGDGGPRGGVGGGRGAAQPEDLCAQQPHLRRDRREDEQRGVPQDGGAVPVEDEEAEEDVQALLQQPEVDAAASPRLGGLPLSLRFALQERTTRVLQVLQPPRSGSRRHLGVRRRGRLPRRRRPAAARGEGPRHV